MQRATGWPAATCAAIIITTGAALRLYALDAMEFKGDERESLLHAMRLLAEHPWSSDQPFPAYGLISSNGVGNAPLFTWIIAALWAPTRDPLWVTGLIALINVVTLYPFWRWARRRLDEFRGLIALAIVAVSPFFVLYSRKIWAPDLMLTGLLAILWGIEWWRGGRPWRALALLLLAVLVIGQLHQSGPIALALLPIAIGLQMLLDRRSGQLPIRWPRPDRFEAAAIVIVIAINLFFWWPYLRYFITIPAEVFERRQTIAAISPELVRKIVLQMVPTDLFYFFDPHRFQFLDGDWRRWSYTAAVYSGTPLAIYGGWCWLRRPRSVPVLGVWWLMVVAVFALTRILTQPYYALILAPITALLPAGAFDSPTQPRWLKGALGATRIAYVMALLALSAATLSWLSARGGASGEYGIAYRTRLLQARTLASGVGRVTTADADLKCDSVPVEVVWLADWMSPGRRHDDRVVLCENWIDEKNEVVHRWQFAVKAN